MVVPRWVGLVGRDAVTDFRGSSLSGYHHVIRLLPRANHLPLKYYYIIKCYYWEQVISGTLLFLGSPVLPSLRLLGPRVVTIIVR